MKNKSFSAIIICTVLLAAALFFITNTTDNTEPTLPPITLSGNSDVSSDSSGSVTADTAPTESTTFEVAFSEPKNVSEPTTTNTSNGAVATEYEPVYPVNIGSEGVREPVSLHYLVNEKSRKAYTQILNGLKNYSNSVTLSSPVDEDDFLHIMIYVRDYNPDLFFVNWSQYNYKMRSDGKVDEVSFDFLCDNVAQRVAEFENAVNSIVSQANRCPNLFERELFVHDYLVNNVSYYVDSGETGTAYGAIINKKARCEGYARAFQLIMLRLGVPTVSIIGNAQNERHMWNAVDLYGKYYHVDVTFDDNSSEAGITSHSENEIGHSCFNVPTEIISRTHSVSASGSKDSYGAYQNLFLPECNSYDFNYYRIRGLMVENDNQLKYVFKRNVSERRACVFFKGEMPQTEHILECFKSFFEETYSSGGYSIYYTPNTSPVYQRNVCEINWENK